MEVLKIFGSGAVFVIYKLGTNLGGSIRTRLKYCHIVKIVSVFYLHIGFFLPFSKKRTGNRLQNLKTKFRKIGTA